MDRPTLLVFAQHGPVLESLAAFLELASAARIVATVDSVAAMEQALAAGVPDLVILGTGSAKDDVAGLVQQIKAGRPGLRCLALVESREQLAAAQAGGAEAALLWGGATDQLAATVRMLTATEPSRDGPVCPLPQEP
jgi:DNA-binding NarL/FixJ family response regulator